MDPQQLKARFEAEGEQAVRRKVEAGDYRAEELRLANEWLLEKAAERQHAYQHTAPPSLAQSRLNTVIGISGWLLVLVMAMVVVLTQCTGS